MSLAAIPAYFLARRLLPATLSLVCAGLAVLIPSMLYTGMLMTENAFYPLFLLAAYLLVLVLEEPTAFRQIALLAVCAVAFETRAQAVALFAAAATAPVLLALIERRGSRATLRRYSWIYGLLGGGALLALAATTAAGRSPLQPARRLSRSDDELLHRERDPALLPLPRVRARSLPRHPPVRRARGAVARPSSADPRGEGLRRRIARDQRLAGRGGRCIRLGELRQPDRGAEHLLPRSARADRPRGPCPRRRDHAPPPRPRRGRPRGGDPAVLHPVHALHQRECPLRHLRAAAVVVGTGQPDPPAAGALGRARRVACRGRALRLPAAPLRARATHPR